MKNAILFSFLLIAFIFPARAQFTLDASKMPGIGDNEDYQYSDTNGVSPGPAGMGQTWDFSAVPDSAGTFNFSYMDPASTPSAATFAGISNLASSQLPNEFLYWDSQPTAFTNVGISDQYTLNTALVYSDPAIKFTFPMSFGNTVTDSFSGDYFSVLGTVYRRGEMITTIDGTGDITLPDASVYNGVIRVKQITSIKDSAQSPLGTVIGYLNYVRYEWYDASLKLPVMVHETWDHDIAANVIQDVFIYYITNLTAIDGPQGIDKLEIFPNPTKGQALVKFELTQPQDIKATLLNLVGQEVLEFYHGKMGAGNHNLEFDASGLEKGVYFLRIKTSTGQTTEKIILH